MKVKDCRFGPMMYLENDMFIGGAIEAYAEHHVTELELLFDLVEEGDYVIDAGTNIGTISIPLAQRVGDKGFLFGFEPQEMLFYTFCGNIALNSLRNVKAFNQAVGSQPGVIYVPEFSYKEEWHNYGGVSLSKKDGIPVKMTTLDSLISVIDKLKLIKIDVEGMEEQVLRGAKDLIAKTRPFLTIEVLKNHAVVCDILKDYGYKICVWEPPYFNPNNFARNSENILKRAVKMQNIFCYPEEKKREVDSPYFINVTESDHPRHKVWEALLSEYELGG